MCCCMVCWDFSRVAFNLGGRINRLYGFFWRVAAVVWLKYRYRVLSGLIEKIPLRAGKVITWLLIVFMAVNVSVSCLALVRYDQRSNGIGPDNAVEEWIDEHFDDGRMERIYPNAMKR